MRRAINLTVYYGLLRRLDRMDMKIDMLWKWFQREHDMNNRTEKKT